MTSWFSASPADTAGRLKAFIKDHLGGSTSASTDIPDHPFDLDTGRYCQFDFDTGSYFSSDLSTGSSFNLTLPYGVMINLTSTQIMIFSLTLTYIVILNLTLTPIVIFKLINVMYVRLVSVTIAQATARLQRQQNRCLPWLR